MEYRVPITHEQESDDAQEQADYSRLRGLLVEAESSEMAAAVATRVMTRWGVDFNIVPWEEA